PRSMLYARASGDVARRIAPDALLGMAHNVEELTVAGEVSEPQRPAAAADRMRAALGSQPAEEPEPETPTAEPDPEPSPDAITSAQQKKMGALMREVGITQRDLALAFVADVIGREVDSRNELTKVEAGRVIDALEADAARADEPVDAEGVADEPLIGGDQ